MDLRERDVLDLCGFGSSQVEPGTFVARVDAITPDVPISIQVRNRRDDQGKGPFQTVTTKRQSPALTLFPSSDPAGEWVLWMPQGYYDTSIEGDGKYLGWHLNQSWLDQPKPTLHYPIKQFQNKLNRKDIIDRLLATADLDATLAALVSPDQPEPPKLVIKEQPPSVAVEVTEQDGKRAQAHVYAKSASNQEIERIEIRTDTELVRMIPYPPGTTVVDQKVTVPLDRIVLKINVTPFQRDGGWQTRSVNIVCPGIQTLERKPRLVILTLGVDTFPTGRFPPVLHADRDARDLADFFKAHLLAPSDGSRFDSDQVEVYPFTGAEARADQVLAMFELLRARFQEEPLGKDDLVVVAVESHFVSHERRGLLLTADSAAQAPLRRRSRPTISARAWARWPTRGAR